MKSFNILIALALLIVMSCKEKKPAYPAVDQLNWLQGSWITDDSTSIETWALQDGELKGNSYSNREGKITEQLRIYSVDGQPAYEAKVSAQNNGQPVSFMMVSTGTDSLHFSNPSHDFPTDIVYVKNPDHTLSCKVYSSTSKGLTLHMTKLAE